MGALLRERGGREGGEAGPEGVEVSKEEEEVVRMGLEKRVILRRFECVSRLRLR